MYVNISNPSNGIIKNIREHLPNISLPENITKEILQELGYDIVERISIPIYNTLTHKIELSNVPQYNNSLNLWEQVYNIIPLTEEEISFTYNNQCQEVIYRRNSLLNQSDWTQLPDAPVDKQAWATYRQALRDITLQVNYPEEVTWPNPPVP